MSKTKMICITLYSTATDESSQHAMLHYFHNWDQKKKNNKTKKLT